MGFEIFKKYYEKLSVNIVTGMGCEAAFLIWSFVKILNVNYTERLIFLVGKMFVCLG